MPRTRKITVKIRTNSTPAPRKRPSRTAALVGGGADATSDFAGSFSGPVPGPGDHAHGHLQYAGFGHRALPGDGPFAAQPHSGPGRHRRP